MPRQHTAKVQNKEGCFLNEYMRYFERTNFIGKSNRSNKDIKEKTKSYVHRKIKTIKGMLTDNINDVFSVKPSRLKK